MGALSNIENLIRKGCLSSALEETRKAVRDFPADLGFRRALFALLATNGEWQKCRQQAEVLSKLETDPTDWISVMGILNSAMQRDAFWAGSGEVSILGDPGPEDRLSLEAAIRSAASGPDEIVSHAAFGPGRFNFQDFELLGTADDRLPGVLEVSMDGQYHWLWLGSVQRIEAAVRRKSMIDAMWIPVRLVLDDESHLEATLFGFYPGTHLASSERVRLGIELRWRDDVGEAAVAEGPQILIVDDTPHLVKDLKVVEFDGAEVDPIQLSS